MKRYCCRFKRIAMRSVCAAIMLLVFGHANAVSLSLTRITQYGSTDSSGMLQGDLGEELGQALLNLQNQASGLGRITSVFGQPRAAARPALPQHHQSV